MRDLLTMVPLLPVICGYCCYLTVTLWFAQCRELKRTTTPKGALSWLERLLLQSSRWRLHRYFRIELCFFNSPFHICKYNFIAFMGKSSTLFLTVTRTRLRSSCKYVSIKSHGTPPSLLLHVDRYIFHTRTNISRGWIYSDGQCLLAGYIPQDRTQVIEDTEGWAPPGQGEASDWSTVPRTWRTAATETTYGHV